MLPVRTSGPVVGASADAAIDPTTGGIEVAIVGGSGSNLAEESGGNLAAAKTDLDELLVEGDAPTTFATGQAPTSTSASPLSSLSGGPSSTLEKGGFILRNVDPTNTVYVGTSSSVTASNGWPLLPGESSPNLGQDPSKIWLVASAGTPKVAWMWSTHA